MNMLERKVCDVIVIYVEGLKFNLNDIKGKLKFVIGLCFIKLNLIDDKYKYIVLLIFMINKDKLFLSEIVIYFINYVSLYYNIYYLEKIVFIFIVGLVMFKILILEGILGIGKISLFYVFGKFIKNDVFIILV